MNQFELFRVADWIDEDGLLKRFEVVAREVIAGVKGAAGAAFLGAATFVSIPAAASGVAWTPSPEAQRLALANESAVDRVARLDEAMAENIAKFMSLDYSDIDPAVLAAAADFLKVVHRSG